MPEGKEPNEEVQETDIEKFLEQAQAVAEEIEDLREEVNDEHKAREEAETRADAAEEEVHQLRQALQAFGGHNPECLSGALAGAKALHPLCTCGWNGVATEIERW